MSPENKLRSKHNHRHLFSPCRNGTQQLRPPANVQIETTCTTWQNHQAVREFPEKGLIGIIIMYVPGKFLRQKILLTIFKVSVGMSLGLVLLVRYCKPVFIDGTAPLAPSANQIRTLTWLFKQPVSSKYKRKNIFRLLSR